MQEEAVEYVASIIEKADSLKDGKRRIFLIQTYVIGKERILIEVSPSSALIVFTFQAATLTGFWQVCMSIYVQCGASSTCRSFK